MGDSYWEQRAAILAAKDEEDATAKAPTPEPAGKAKARKTDQPAVVVDPPEDPPGLTGPTIKE